MAKLVAQVEMDLTTEDLDDIISLCKLLNKDVPSVARDCLMLKVRELLDQYTNNVPD